jgi:hypothetical protein
VSAAEKRLAQATAAVEDAGARLRGAEVEANRVFTEAAGLDESIRATVYAATAAGDSPSNVRGDRERLAQLREQLEMFAPVGDALQDGLRKAEQARDKLIADEFPELRSALAAHAAKIRAERDDMYQRFAEEETRMRDQVSDVEARWRDLTRPLPQPIRPGDMTSDLGLPMCEAHPGLGIYIADESWPPWAAAILEQSRHLRAEETTRLRLTNMPVAG